MSNEKGGRISPALALAGEATPDCRFPPPWTIEDNGDACFTSGEFSIGRKWGRPLLGRRLDLIFLQVRQG